MIMAANHNPPAIFAPFTACPRKQETPAMLYFMRLRRLCRVFNISPYKRHTLVFLKRLNPVFSKRGHAPPFNKKKKKKAPFGRGGAFNCYENKLRNIYSTQKQEKEQGLKAGSASNPRFLRESLPDKTF